MKVTVYSCGPAANDSELKAFKHLEGCLKSAPGNDWRTAPGWPLY